MTAGLNTEGNDPSLALGWLERGFPHTAAIPSGGSTVPSLDCGVVFRASSGGSWTLKQL